MTIHDLLTMSAGHDTEPLPWPLNPPLMGDFVAAVLAKPVEHAPGSKFAYSNGAMMMLAECFLRKTGQNLSDYAREHLFTPLGITDFDWERFESGLGTGGWGLRLRSEDIMKFGLMLLNHGRWDGRQVVPEAYVERATSALVSNAGGPMENPDRQLGYGYLFWQTSGGHGARRRGHVAISDPVAEARSRRRHDG